jgi:2-methylaconitate cis-trans-isomerase PrpF
MSKNRHISWMLIGGGTLKGAYFLVEDLPLDEKREMIF